MITNTPINRSLKSYKTIICTLCLSLLSCSQIPLLAKSSLPGENRMNGKNVEAAFEKQRLILQQHSAAIYMKRKPIGYGVIMSQDGHILTKRSELFNFDKKEKKDILKKDITVYIDQTKYNKVTLLASDTVWDLAILKVDASELKPITWSEQTNIEQGTWVVTNGSTTKRRRRLNIGIISAKSRKIEGPLPVIFGLLFTEVKDNGGLEIQKVSPKSGAEAAGILKGDIIKKLEGQKVVTKDKVLEIIRKKQPGDFATVEILRAKKKLTLKIELKARKEILGASNKPKSRSDHMSGDYSKRRDSFPMVLQHDIDHNSRQTGGPLITLEGKAIGINIARANRAESFAIPAKEAQQVYQKMLQSIPK